jgi:P-type Ca2+ transporter type 2C
MEEEKAWYQVDFEEAIEALESSHDGLTNEEAVQRLEKYGRNELEQERDTSWTEILVHQFINPLVVVLVVAGVIALLAGKMIDTIVIGVVIIVNAAIGFFQEFRAEAAISALQKRAAPLADVLRCKDSGDCEQTNIPTQEVVPGDVILLEAGDKVPADARVFEAKNLEVDESMLTGESVPVKKKIEKLDEDLSIGDRTNLVFGGTIVTEGRGKAVVYATGQKSQMGEIAKLIQETEKAESPLQIQTNQLGKKLGFLAFVAGSLIFIMGFIRGFDLESLLLFSIATVVSSIPEGLPAVMTITLAVGVNRMARRNAIIRRLPAVDTLGATTVISTDKTGTLTTNQMTVQEIFMLDRVIKVTGTGFTPEGEFLLDEDEIEVKEGQPESKVLKIGVLCNDSALVQEDDRDIDQWSIVGDPTEGALLVAARKAGFIKKELDEEYSRIDEIPFSSEKKFMATFHDTPEGEVMVCVKGAPETVLEHCSQIIGGDGNEELRGSDKEKILDTNEEMAKNALRVLGVAYHYIDKGDVEKTKEQLENRKGELVFGGLLGMMDPPRPEVLEAIERCKRAGIKVMMVTGDHKITGEAVAREVKICDKNQKVFTGQELEEMSDDELDEVILDTAVFARVSPAHKQRIVASLQRHGHVVAMTGDGVNDAPALKAAQIGVAMGIAGTDVTKETAEMVLTDDNFASIVNAVEEGRVVFQNVRKVVQFLITTNIGEVLTLLGAIWLLPAGQLIFTPIQILWVNLVTDGLLDITIALEPKEGDVMDQKPRKPETRIIDRGLFFQVIYVAIFMAIGTLWIYLSELNAGEAQRAQTMAFITIAMFQVFNSFNVRSRTRSLFQLGVFSNKYLIGAIVISVSLLVLVTLVPFLQIAMDTIPLALRDWGLIVLVASSVFIAGELMKLVWRKTRKV